MNVLFFQLEILETTLKAEIEELGNLIRPQKTRSEESALGPASKALSLSFLR
mgnify:CR=1 FL=1|jgi:hypothetical protein